MKSALIRYSVFDKGLMRTLANPAPELLRLKRAYPNPRIIRKRGIRIYRFWTFLDIVTVIVATHPAHLGDTSTLGTRF